MAGFFVMERDALSHHLVGGPKGFYPWSWMIATACWKPTPFNINGKTVTLERGQLCVSVRQLAEAWEWSKSAVDRFLSRLETETMIERNPGHGKLVITICNYDKYQDLQDRQRDSSGTATGTAAGQQRDTKEPSNHKTNKPKKDNTPLPPIPDWMPVEAWNGYLQMRFERKKPPTARAVELLVGKLDRWRCDGHDPAEILNTSTVAGWTDLYEPKGKSNGNANRKANGDGRSTLARIIDEQLDAF